MNEKLSGHSPNARADKSLKINDLNVVWFYRILLIYRNTLQSNDTSIDECS